MDSKLHNLPLLFDQATRFHQGGSLAEAERLYLQILTADPASFSATHMLGVVRLQQGRKAEALDLIEGALALNPRDPEVLVHHGLALQMAGRPQDALSPYEKALTIKPDYAEAWNNRGNALRIIKRYQEALASFDQALQIKPDYAEAWSNRGITLRDLKQPEKALASYDRAIAIKPKDVTALYNRANTLLDLHRLEDALDGYTKTLAAQPHHADALYNRGNVLRSMRRYSDALVDYDKTLALSGEDAEAWNNRGVALRELNRPQEALESHDRSLALNSDEALVWYNRARALQDLSRLTEALASYERAITIHPRFAAAWNNRGNILRNLKRLDEALACYSNALAIDPNFAEAGNNQGNTFQDLKRFDEALASFDKLLRAHPTNADALYNRGTTLLHLRRFSESLASHEKALDVNPNHRDALGGAANAALHLCDWPRMTKLAPKLSASIAEGISAVPPFVLLGYTDDAEMQLQCAKNYIADRLKIVPPQLWDGVPYRHDRIRVAYISSDFRQHPVANQIVQLIENHDRSGFEVLGISLGNDDGSDVRHRLLSAFDQFYDVSSKSDQAVAELLRTLEVDVAIDLNGHTQDARPGIFAYHPAPVQVNYLGYAGTMGSDFIDYVIADEIALPFEQQRFFTEKIVRLTDCFFPTNPERTIGPTPTRAQAGLPEQGFVFCCFNSNYKFAPGIFDIWMRLLRQVEGSVLWLQECNATASENLKKEATARGVNAERLIFAKHLPLPEHLARHRCADLFLDTLPYNAHATASDTLWAGLPLLTCRGTAFAGRVAASMLSALGLAELITSTLEEYERLALGLARDPARLNQIRLMLSQNRLTYPLFDALRFRLNIEAAYKGMIENAGRDKAPKALDIVGTSGLDDADTLSSRAIALWQEGRREEALAGFDRAVAINPNSAEAWNNRGAALQASDRPDEALASYDSALAIRTDYVDSLHNRAQVLSYLKRYQDALADYDRLLTIRPDRAEVWNNRAGVLWDMKCFAEALASYDRALTLKPDYAEALYKRGRMLWAEKRDLGAAIRNLEQAVLANPNHDYARGDLLHLKMQCGDWRGFEREAALIDEGVRDDKRIAQPFVYLAISQSPADLQKCAEIFAQHQYPATAAFSPVISRRRHRSKIRLGYVSGEFREQATAYLTAGLYERHDKSRFELIAFDNGRSDKGPTRKRLEAAFDKFFDIADLSDRAAAEKVLAEEIDILINLNGYFGRHRMGVFARRPAPIQVNYLGFPATLGANYMDYIVADRVVIPPTERDYYMEKVVWLPGTYQVNDSGRPAAATTPPRAAHSLPENDFVFCNFNQSYKLTPAMFALWMRILKKAPGSVLWLLECNEYFAKNLRHEAVHQGVAAERLIFAPTKPVEDHLARLGAADLFLDSLPYGAHTTASDALWTGLPLLTCRGEAFAGRVAASLLQAVGLPELVTENFEAYESLAVRLAKDSAMLATLRRKLAANRANAFNTDRFRGHIEAAYIRMWDIHCQGGEPQDFEVLALPGSE